MPVTADIFAKLDVREAVFLKRVHFAGLGLARLEEAKRFGNRNLVVEELMLAERLFGETVARLDNAGRGG